MQEAEMARRQQEKETDERLKEIENFRVQEDKTKEEKYERKTGQKTCGNTDMESVQQDKGRVQRTLGPAVPLLKVRVIECKPRPKPDLTPEYGLEPKADPAPRPRAEKADMELLDIEDEELALMGNNKIMHSSDLEKAQHKLQKEARRRSQAEAVEKCYRHNDEEILSGSSNISKEDSAPPMKDVNGMTNGDMEGRTGSSNSNEADERTTKVDSVTGKVIGWVNKKVKERYERKIARTYWREETQSDQLYINGVVICSRAQREREKRAKLLKGEQTRRRLERRWQEWEKRDRKNNMLKRVQRNGLWYRELENKNSSQGSHEDISLPDEADEADGDEEVEYLLMYGPCDCELCRDGYKCLWYSYDKEETDPKEARSKRRRIINWINTRVKEDYRKRINTTFNIQSLVCNDYAIYGNAILRQWDLQKIIRQELVKKEERRQRLEKRWKEWEKARTQKINTILQEKKAKEQARLNRLIGLNLEADQKIKEFIAANPGIQSQYPGGHTRVEMMGHWDMGYRREETQGQEGRVGPATVQKSTAPLWTKKITKWQKLKKW